MQQCKFETAASCGIDCSYKGNRQAHEEPPVPQWHECHYCGGTVEGTACLQCGESG